MSVSFFFSALLASGLSFLPAKTVAPTAPTTHTLAIKVHQGGKLIIDGVAVGDTTLQLSNAHVATLAEAGNTLFTVIYPDGEIFYKGDFTLAVQSISSGTVKIQLQDGEAILARAEKE